MIQHIKNNRNFSLKALLLFVVFHLSFYSFAQTKKGKNIVPNPSFETHKNATLGDIKNAVPWIGIGTVDFYMKPEKRDTSRFKGAHKGTCYAGLRFQENYKEYMYVKLEQPLEKDAVYNFRMYVRMLEAKNVTVTIKQLGVYFSEVPFKVGLIFSEDGLIDSTNKKGLSGLNWMLIQGDYKAHGGEKYIIIGNFRTKVKDDMIRKKKFDLFGFQEAYYYIDDVTLRKKIIPVDSVEASKQAELYKLPVLPEKLDDGQIITIEKIQFEKGTDELTKSSYRFLDEYLDLLDQNPFMQVEIVGHTDNQGNEISNKKLSTNRAKAVYQYFKDQEALNPMAYKGMGSSTPIVPNDTPEGREKNNRIEIVIINQ